MPDKLRIALWYNLPSGGARRALYDQVKGLLARGHHIEAWHPLSEESPGGFADVGTLLEEHVAPLGIPMRMPTWLEVGFPERTRRRAGYRQELMERMRAYSAGCAREIEAKGFDVLLAHSDAVFHAPFIGREVREIPRVLYLHEPNRRLSEAFPDSVWAQPTYEHGSTPLRLFHAAMDRIDHRADRIQAREEARNARSFDRVLVNSYFTREAALRVYGPRELDVRVCYLGLDLDRIVHRELARERFVVGLGSVSPAKNVEAAIRAVAAIERDRPPLVWVGNFAIGSYASEMESLAKALDVDLRYKVRVSDEELGDILSRAQAMVCSPHLEPFGYAPLEANACGLAVAAIAEGGLRETIVDGVNGVLAAPDPVSLGRAIEKVLSDPEMGARAERHVRENWGLARSIDDVERHLVEVSGKG